jgi:predicted DNA-binding transcriptional regulator AlpA
MSERRIATRVLRMRHLPEKTGMCTSHLYALIARGEFIKPFPLVPGGRAVGWLQARRNEGGSR